MNKKLKNTLIFILCAAIFVGIFALLSALVRPKYTLTNLPEGKLVGEYYDEQHDHDILFVGDCEVYENYSPVLLWQRYGVTSYIRGSAQQLIWQSYYLLEEMLEKETPSAVVYNIQAMQYNEPQEEAYNRLTLDGMKLSKHKIDAINASVMRDENGKCTEEKISYYLPLLRYHARWSELDGTDVNYLFTETPNISHNGFLMRSDIKPAGMQATVKEKTKSELEFGENSWKYLNMMADLCEEKGVKLILVKAPALRPYWYPRWDEQIVQFAKERKLTYINFIDYFGLDTSGNTVVYSPAGYTANYIVDGWDVSETDMLSPSDMIDFETDTYDGGQHMNLSGAEKLTDVFGRIITGIIDFPDHSNDKELAYDWSVKIERYEWMLKDQAKELAEKGWLESYGAKKPDKLPVISKTDITEPTPTDISGRETSSADK